MCVCVCVCVCVFWLLSRVRLSVTPWTVVHQAPLSMEFSRQEYWSGLPFLLQGTFLTQGSNPGLPHCRQILYHLSHQGSPTYSLVAQMVKPNIYIYIYKINKTYYVAQWRRQWHPTPALLPEKSHGQRSLVGCRLWGRTESDTTEAIYNIT